ncbi:MAG: hypothetical protein R2780_05800 [Crocinitomicaceae bacterium]
MKLVKFYSDGELSPIKVSSTEETVAEVQNLFFEEQLAEEQIILEIYSKNNGQTSEVDELRLDFDRIYSRKQLNKKVLLSGYKLVDSSVYQNDFSIQTILGIKNEQRYLNASFKGYMLLIPRGTNIGGAEPMLFASLKNENFYLLNKERSLSPESKFKSILSWIKGISFKMFSK